jgi:YVTN family beta-propeller protein
MCKIAAFVLLVAGIALPSMAQGGPFAYVTNSSSGSVTVIDTSTNTVVTTISLCGDCGPQPKGLAVTPNGNSVYVANSGNGTVSVIAASTNTVSTTITLCPACTSASTPVGIVITPDGTRAYVTDTAQNAIYVIDTNPSDATYNTVTATITADVSQPGAIAMSPDGSAAYYTFGNSEGRIDTNPASPNFNRHTTTFTVGTTPTGIAVTPDSTLLYVANNGSGTVSVVTTGLTPITVATVTVGAGAHFVAITPNGQFAYVVNESSDTVLVISTTTQTMVATISGSCIFTNQIAITPDGTQAYVADSECDTADVISTASNTQTTSVSVGSSPFGVAIGPATNTVTVGPFPVFPGATVNFIDGTIINQKVTIPPDAMMNGVAFMEMRFTQVNPAVFNSTRLTGVLGNPWSGGNQGPYSSPPTTCTVITGTVGNANCMVMEGRCFDSAMNPLPTCSITKTTTQIILTSSYMTPFPQPTPGFLIADDGQNNWANILIGFDASSFNLNDPTIHGGTNGCQMDTVIVNLGGPATPTPSSVNFGNVPVGGFPIRAVKVTNNGTAPLNITTKLAALPGQDSNDFFTLSLCFKPLQPMQSCFIIVAFFGDEITHQQQSATLNITDGAPPNNPLLIVPLSATVVKRQ